MLQLLADVGIWFASLKKDERGATAVEYGLMVALIAVAIILVVTNLGQAVMGAFQDIVDGF